MRSIEDAFKAQGAPLTRAEIRAAIETGTDATATLLATLAKSATSAGHASASGKPPTLVISIDQGEELFSSEGADEAKKLLSLFRDILARETPSCLGLITIRSDAYEHLQTAAELETVPQQTLVCRPSQKALILK